MHGGRAPVQFSRPSPMTQLLASPPLDSQPDEGFDRLTRLAARLLGAPVALVSILGEDQVYFKSAMGLPEPWATRRTAPLAYSFCRHVVATGAPLVVEDARRHPLVRSNPSVRELRWIAYAGVPLTLPDGRTVGALCVVDAMPRLWSPRDLSLLGDLAASVTSEIELRAARDQRPHPTPAVPAARDAELFDRSAAPMGLIQADGRWLRVNPALAVLLGTTPEALAGTPAEARTHPADRGADAEAVRLLAAGEVTSYTAEKRLIGPGDETVWVAATVTAVPGGPDHLPLLHLVCHDLTDRKLAEADLRLREERYRLAVEAAQDAVWDWDLLTDRVVWTERAEGPFGYHRSGRSGSAAWWYERLHADDRERIVSGMQAAIASGASAWADQYRFRRASGAYAWVRDRAAVVRDEAGDAVRMVGSVVDATSAQRAELLVRGQSGLLEQIAVGLDLPAVLERVVRFTEAHEDGLIAAILIAAPEAGELRLAAGPGLPAAVRQRLVALPLELGAGPGALAAGRREPVAFPDLTGEQAPGWAAPLVAAGITGAWSAPLFAADGSVLGTLELLALASRGSAEPDRTLIELAGHLAEIAIERDRSRDALARERQLFEQVLDHLPVGVWVLDREGRTTFENPAGRTIWAGTRPNPLEAAEGCRGWRVDTAAPLGPAEWPASRAFRQGETCLDEAIMIETLDGGQKTVVESAVPLRSLAGEVVGAIVVSQDVSDRRAADEALRQSEDRLRHAQKMEAVGQLAGGIAHDFNNLLTGILSYVELIQHELRPDDPIRDDLAQIRHTGERAAALTRQLLAFSRRQVLQPRVLSLNAVVSELDPMLRGLLGPVVALEITPDPALGLVLADPGQLGQVLVNLAVNARDAMPAGGTVTITTANIQLGAADDARANGVRAGAYVTLSVRDTGVGMDVPTQARIFDPFFSTRATGQGSGLGLSTVYGIVEQSGGHIAVESAPAQGATFTIFLPRHEAADPAPPAALDRRRLPTGQETLLLVEDEAAVRSSVRRLLERHGYTIVEARHGQDALTLMESGAVRIDMVVTDLVMPEIGGRELVERLRARHPGLKVLFMSGYSEMAVAGNGVMPQGSGFVEKPFTVEQLIRRTREILDG
jgi:two-component system cell cycle sensor histidine kinase/response regulator CckA